jgi:hypothetical protein
MYHIQASCDECGLKDLRQPYERGRASLSRILRARGWHASGGICLCPEHNTGKLRRRHRARHRDMQGG